MLGGGEGGGGEEKGKKRGKRRRKGEGGEGKGAGNAKARPACSGPADRHRRGQPVGRRRHPDAEHPGRNYRRAAKLNSPLSAVPCPSATPGVGADHATPCIVNPNWRMSRETQPRYPKKRPAALQTWRGHVTCDWGLQVVGMSRNDHTSLRPRVSRIRSHRAPRVVRRGVEARPNAAALVATASACMEVNDLDAAARSRRGDRAGAGMGGRALTSAASCGCAPTTWSGPAKASSEPPNLLPRFCTGVGEPRRHARRARSPQEALGGVRARARAGPVEPAGPEQRRRRPARARPFGGLGGRVPAGDPAHPGDGLWPLQSRAYTVFTGPFQAALSAYAEGQAATPEKNPVQASRLALCKVATGDAAGGAARAAAATNGLPAAISAAVAGDTSAILWALVTQHPELEGWQPVHAWLSTANEE